MDTHPYSLSEFATRGALFTGGTIVVTAVAIGFWWFWSSRTVRGELAVPVRILITGSRGKSSLVRLLHAALSAGGFAAYAKMTGTNAAEIDTVGVERPTPRIGQVSVIEMLAAADRALRHCNPAPTALVFESMGVQPHLLELSAERMVRPTITVITNALHDHLEDQGATPDLVAESLTRSVGPDTGLVITGETAAGPLARIRRRVEERGIRLVESARAPAPAAALTAIPFAHPANLAMALAITRELGIPDPTAIAGMRASTQEPNDRTVVDVDIDGFDFTFLDLGSVNDVDSLLTLLPLVKEQRRGRPVVAEIVARWDRPLRALQFAGFLDPARWDGVLLIGDAAHPVRQMLLRSGFTGDRILGVSSPMLLGDRWRGPMDRFLRGIRPGATGCVVVRMQNIHDPVAERMVEALDELATQQAERSSA